MQKTSFWKLPRSGGWGRHAAVLVVTMLGLGGLAAVSAPAAGAAPVYVCSGTFETIPAGTYGSVTVTGHVRPTASW